jgi:hypothetical protein
LLGFAIEKTELIRRYRDELGLQRRSEKLYSSGSSWPDSWPAETGF